MRLGGQECSIADDSLSKKLYKKSTIVERHRHRYEVNPKFKDILVNGGVIISLLLVMFLDWSMADPIVALLIAGFIIYSAGRIARESINHLMDHELPDGERERIKEIVLKHPAVLDCHDLKTRAAGLNSFIQLHISMDGSLSLGEAHEICDTVELDILNVFPYAEVLIHADPEGVDEIRQEF